MIHQKRDSEAILSAFRAQSMELMKENARRLLSGEIEQYKVVLKQAKKAIKTLMSCNEISVSADTIGEEALAAIDKVAGE